MISSYEFLALPLLYFLFGKTHFYFTFRAVTLNELFHYLYQSFRAQFIIVHNNCPTILIKIFFARSLACSLQELVQYGSSWTHEFANRNNSVISDSSALCHTDYTSEHAVYTIYLLLIFFYMPLGGGNRISERWRTFGVFLLSVNACMNEPWIAFYFYSVKNLE